MKTVFVFVVLLAACFRGEGQLLLSPGDQWTYQFEILPRTGSTNSFLASPGGSLEFTVDGNSLQNGDSLTYEMFESNTNEAPICSGTMTLGSSLTLACNVPGAWQQLHGAIRFTMVAGSVTVDTVRLQAIVSGPSLSSYEVYSSSFVPVWPRLSIARVGSAAAQITWATNFTDYRLEYATNLPVTVWNRVTNRVTTTADRLSVTVATDAAQRVYRLHKP
jgi:hypothetical protein